MLNILDTTCGKEDRRMRARLLPFLRRLMVPMYIIHFNYTCTRSDIKGLLFEILLLKHITIICRV